MVHHYIGIVLVPCVCWIMPATHHTQDVGSILLWCWSIVYDDAPTLKQHWVNVLSVIVSRWSSNSLTEWECPVIRWRTGSNLTLYKPPPLVWLAALLKYGRRLFFTRCVTHIYMSRYRKANFYFGPSSTVGQTVDSWTITIKQNVKFQGRMHPEKL